MEASSVSAWIQTIAGALLGAIASFALPLWFRARRNRARNDIVGFWKSTYLLEETRQWVEDEVEIYLEGAKFCIRNTSSPHDVLYEGEAVLRGEELVGSWRTKGAQSGGHLLLIISPTGRLIYGYYTGLRHNNERVFAAWVFGKSDQDIQHGKRLLSSQTLPISPA